MTTICMGPILSFRGCVGINNEIWRVSALFVIPKNENFLSISIEGKSCDAPVVLFETTSKKILRYDFTAKLESEERRVVYSINNGDSFSFTVPCLNSPPRMAYVSCNGFSDPKAVQKLNGPINAVWNDLLCNHDPKMRDNDYVLDKEQRWHEKVFKGGALQRFHLMAMGGDQIYFDSILYENKTLPELCKWSEWSTDRQIEYKPTEKLKQAISNYYIDLYIERWSIRTDSSLGKPEKVDCAAPSVMASIPTIMMWDDHDIIDGWGSYTKEMQYCPVMQHIFNSARKAFWIFQLQQKECDLPTLKDLAWNGSSAPDAPDYEAIDWEEVLVEDPLSMPLLNGQPGFSYSFNIGALSIIVPDLRTERSRIQILGEATWSKLIACINHPTEAEHVLIMSSVPVAYPKLGLAELGVGLTAPNLKTGLSDDLNDQWTHRHHEGERKRLIRAVVSAAQDRKVRFTFLSGDVHVACWGTIYRKDITNEKCMRINQLTSSSIVHPSPTGLVESLFLAYVNNAASSVQPIDSEHNMDMMLFPSSDMYVHAARNWLALEFDTDLFKDTGRRRLWASWRCEVDGKSNTRSFSNHLLAVHPVKT